MSFPLTKIKYKIRKSMTIHLSIKMMARRKALFPWKSLLKTH